MITSDEGIGVLRLSENTNKLSGLVNMPNDSWFGGWRYDARPNVNRISGLGDFDGDGAVEVLITSDWGIGILKQRQDKFDSLVVQPTGTWFGGWNYDSTNRIAGIGDFNGDRKAEILITSDWGIGVLALQDDTLQSLAVQPSGSRFGGWLYDSSNNRVAGVGDFNGDGRDEFVVISPWVIGLLAFVGESFGCLDLRPYGSILGNWALEKTDQIEGVGDFTRSRRRELLIRKWGGLK